MLKLHHCAKRIKPNTLEFVIELFQQLNCELAFRESDNARWAMISQPNVDFLLQFIERDQDCIPTEIKKESHIAFISDDQMAELKKIEQWITNQKVKFVKNSWSEKEHYFDCPEIFIDFVIEVMHKSIVEG